MEDTRLQAKIAEMLDRAVEVNYETQLPETEFDVMNAIWDAAPPLTTGYLMEVLGNARGWKTPTLISFLLRLEERGFIGSVKIGRDRYYFPLADREKYLSFVTGRFIRKYHKGSFIHMMDVLFPDKKLSEDDIDALLAWLRDRN